MSKSKQLSDKLNDSSFDDGSTPGPSLNKIASIANIDWHDFEYKQFGAEPKINLSPLVLIILVPVLYVLHIQLAKTFEIPFIQYSFITMLVAFVVNYTAIIRTYELMPYLPVPAFDNKLKILSISTVVAVILSMYVGWNGSGGMIFAIFWEQTRGSKIGVFGLFFGFIIVGSLLMEHNYTTTKFIEFLPGIIFGYINSEIYKLKSSNCYAMTHQFAFLSSIVLPVFFPASTMVVPNLLQWGIMIVCGFGMIYTIAATIRLMQQARVSVVMGVFSGLMMVGTSAYTGTIDYIGLILIAIGVILLVKQQFYDLQC